MPDLLTQALVKQMTHLTLELNYLKFPADPVAAIEASIGELHDFWINAGLTREQADAAVEPIRVRLREHQDDPST